MKNLEEEKLILDRTKTEKNSLNELLIDQKKESSVKIAQALSNIETLTSQLHEEQSRGKAEISSLKSQLDNTTSENKKLKSALSELTTKAADDQKSTNGLHEKIVDMTRLLSESLDKEDQMKKETSHKDNIITSQTAEIETLKKDLEIEKKKKTPEEAEKTKKNRLSVPKGALSPIDTDDNAKKKKRHKKDDDSPTKPDEQKEEREKKKDRKLKKDEDKDLSPKAEAPAESDDRKSHRKLKKGRPRRF